MMKRFLIFLLISVITHFISAFTLPLKAQDALVKGRVSDENGEVLSGANLVVKNTMLGVMAGADGEFELKLDPGQNYKVQVSFIGCESQVLDLVPPYKNYYEVHLQRSAFIAEEVIVTGTRAGSKTPMAYENMDREEIRNQDMGQDMGYLLSLTPSVVQSSESGTGIGYTNFRIRGSDPSRINITVDGIPLNDAESQQVFWVNMPAFSSSLNSVQIQRGVGTSTNGAAAFGATVNMQTEAPAKDAYAEIGSTFGSYNTFINTIKAGTGLIKDRLAFDVRYSKMKSD